MAADFDLTEATAVLERTPATLSAMLQGLPDIWLRATEGENTWSPYDVVGHLIHTERTNWMQRAQHILAGDIRPFPPLDRTAHLHVGASPSLSELLLSFADLRQANLSTLASLHLTPADLNRTGLHPAFGQVTLGQLLATWVVHDLDHLGQIARTMAKAYRETVGPWSAYLSILRDREAG